jgi:hypothetical protein
VISDGVVLKPVRAILQFESLLLFVAFIAAYWFLRANWIVFVVLLLAPDLAMLGYLRDTRLGACCYNAAHTYAGPVILGAVSARFYVLAPFAVIWAAHIAMDRAPGYGLKYGDSFGHAHLSMLARRQS